jgi:hypothetical protein
MKFCVARTVRHRPHRCAVLTNVKLANDEHGYVAVMQSLDTHSRSLKVMIDAGGCRITKSCAR